MEAYLLSKKQDAWIRPLSVLISCFHVHGIRAFIDAGTLLAAVRDGRLLPNLDDEDVDFSLVLSLEVIQKLRTALVQIRKIDGTSLVLQDAFGLHVRMKTQYSTLRRLMLVTLYVFRQVLSSFPKSIANFRRFVRGTINFWWHMDEVIVNITFFRESHELYWSAGYKTYLRRAYGSPPVDYIARTVPKELFIANEKADLLGLQVLVPKHSHLRLAQLYGSDWDTPRTTWNYWEESGEVDSDFAESPAFHFVER